MVLFGFACAELAPWLNPPPAPAGAPSIRRRLWRGRQLLDVEHDVVFAAFNDLQPVAGRPDEMGNVDRRERIGAAHFQPVAWRERFQGLADFQRRKRALQSRQIQPGEGHGPTCADRSRRVKLAARQGAAGVTGSGAPGVILAGGLARRMGGGDKPLREVGGRAILARVIERLEPQCDGLVLNANGDPRRFAPFGLPVIADGVEHNLGPLAGVLAALDWATANRPGAEWVLSVPGDCPFLPGNLVARLSQEMRAAELAVAASNGRSHPVIGLWRVGLRDALRRALVVEGLRKVRDFAARRRVATVAWPAEPVDPFFNANTPDDLAEAERLAAIERMGQGRNRRI